MAGLLMQANSKALIALVIGVFLLSANNVLAQCQKPDNTQKVVVNRVVDGDTVVLADGRKVRLLGINTPEMNYDSNSPEPFALEARNTVAAMIKAADSLEMAVGSSRKDRYGRILASIYLNGSGDSLGYRLLEQGLAFPAHRPSLNKLIACYQAVAKQAQQSALGVWGEPQFFSTSSDELKGGYTVLSGTVVDVAVGKGSWWLRLDGNAVLLIQRKNQQYFNPESVKSWLGKEVTVMGWLGRRRGETKQGYADWIMTVHHPAAISLSMR